MLKWQERREKSIKNLQLKDDDDEFINENDTNTLFDAAGKEKETKEIYD